MSSKRNKALAVTATTITLLTLVVVALLVITAVVSRVMTCIEDPSCIRF